MIQPPKEGDFIAMMSSLPITIYHGPYDETLERVKYLPNIHSLYLEDVDNNQRINSFANLLDNKKIINFSISYPPHEGDFNRPNCRNLLYRWMHYAHAKGLTYPHVKTFLVTSPLMVTEVVTIFPNLTSISLSLHEINISRKVLPSDSWKPIVRSLRKFDTIQIIRDDYSLNVKVKLQLLPPSLREKVKIVEM